MISPEAEAYAREIRERGFVVLRDLYPLGKVEQLRRALVEEYELAGRPPVIEQGHLVGKSGYNTSTAAGFAVSRILTSRPEVAPILLEEALIAVVRSALGEDMRLELAGGLISDPSRPFFKWHNHLGGIDERRFANGEVYPVSATPQRILALVYLDDIDVDSGSLLVWPRRIDDPVEAPFPIEERRWESEVVVHLAKGTAVLIEQSTWHAALPQTRDGLRTFIGFYFAAASAPPPQARDESLAHFETDHDLLASVLPRALPERPRGPARDRG